MWTKFETRNYVVFATALMLGILIVTQTESLEMVTDELQRDKETNVFQEISVLKEKNDELRDEVSELDQHLEDLNDQDLALGAIDEEISRYKKLSGKFPVYGSGIITTLKGDISAPWIIDLVNEFFTAGAEADSVNGIRLVNGTIGFDTLPQGQLLLNGIILSQPFQFSVIGEASTISDVLELPGGIFDRLETAYPSLAIEVQAMEIIQML